MSSVPMMYDTVIFAALILGGLVHVTGLSAITSPAFWIAAAPFLYLAWLVLFLTCTAVSTAIFLWFFPKPRNVSYLPGDRQTAAACLGAAFCYMRWQTMRTLPLLSAHWGGSRLLRRLVMRAYSGKPLCEKAALLAELPMDPDLTEIDEGSIVGGETTLVAHAFTTTPDGRVTLACAPIKIGKNVTIGGCSRVEMGCQMGDGSALEPGSVLAPFTVVGPNEIWSGVPATFRRVRTSGLNRENEQSSSSPEDHNSQKPLPSAEPLATRPASTRSAQAVDEERVRQLIRLALGENRESAEWDSLDQMAIASTIHAQTGRPVDAEAVFNLRTMDQVAALLSIGTAPPEKAEIQTEMALVQLPENPELLPLLDRREVSRLLAEEATREIAASRFTSLKNFPVRIAATFTADFLQKPIESWSRRFGIQADVQFAGFNQIPQTLLNPDSLFASNSGGLNVVLVAAEDLPSQKEVEYVDGLLQAVEVFLKNSSGKARLCLCTMPALLSEATAATREAVEQARLLWNSRISQFPDVDIIDFARNIDSLEAGSRYDAELHRIASCPYAMDALNECAIEIVRSMRKSLRPRAKVIAVDCDHTLWGGVIGEVGLHGIDLGEGPHGKSHLALQQWIRAKKEEGILIAIVSRNEESDVWNVFDNHPDMVLRRNDVVAHRINWLPKSENLKSLAEELNLGLDSFVFLDDDPAVRLEVATSLPEVTVVPLDHPEKYAHLVNNLWAFDVLNITTDDLNRTEMMLAERERKNARDRHQTLEDYLAGLQLQVVVKQADEHDLPRVAQLIQKTNQFNLSVIRRTLEEVRLLTDETILVISVADRFGDYGSVGVVILRREDEEVLLLDTFLLSCRVLGRHVEHAVLAAIDSICRDEYAQKLQAIVAETPRNQPARDFIQEAGFSATTPHLWERDLSASYACPQQINLTIQLREHSPSRLQDGLQTTMVAND